MEGGQLDEAALSVGAEPVAIATDGQHVAVAQAPTGRAGPVDRLQVVLARTSAAFERERRCGAHC
jgi:hypothetical protein